MTASLDNLEQLIAQTSSLRGALFVLKNRIKPFGGCHLAYEYMLQPNSYIRGDHISMTTLPRHNTDLYWPSGGSNSDPIIEKIGTMDQPLFVDLEELCGMENTKYYQNRFFSSLIEGGCFSLAAYPLKTSGSDSYGALTVFETRAQRKSALRPKYYIEAGRQFHETTKLQGHISRYFNINDKERHVLEKTAQGRTSSDISHELELTQRAVELRLQSARKKLKARTSAEAVYKATVYSIIFQ